MSSSVYSPRDHVEKSLPLPRGFVCLTLISIKSIIYSLIWISSLWLIVLLNNLTFCKFVMHSLHGLSAFYKQYSPLLIKINIQAIIILRLCFSPVMRGFHSDVWIQIMKLDRCFKADMRLHLWPAGLWIWVTKQPKIKVVAAWSITAWGVQ